MKDQERKAIVKDSKGFTLLELLIALTIFSMIVVVIFACLHMGVRAWEKGEENAQKNQEMRILLDLIPQQIRSLYPYRFKEGNIEFLAFKGNNHSIRFISTLGATSKEPAGLSFVSYFFDPFDGLMLCEKRIFKREMFDDGWDIGKEGIPLSSRVSGITFEYRDDQGEWFKEWDANDVGRFPEAIRLALTYREPPSDQGVITHLTIPIMAKPSQGLGISPFPSMSGTPSAGVRKEDVIPLGEASEREILSGQSGAWPTQSLEVNTKESPKETDIRDIFGAGIRKDIFKNVGQEQLPRGNQGKDMEDIFKRGIRKDIFRNQR